MKPGHDPAIHKPVASGTIASPESARFLDPLPVRQPMSSPAQRLRRVPRGLRARAVAARRELRYEAEQQFRDDECQQAAWSSAQLYPP
jgi:hypothetical protein